jgi:fumarylacetoacetase
MKSWINHSQESDFTIHNLPYGIFSTEGGTPSVGVAIGDKVLDLAGVAANGLFNEVEFDQKVFTSAYLNDFIALGKAKTNKVRAQLQHLLSDGDSALKNHPDLFYKQTEVTLHLPVKVGDYTDFYSSIEHATNVGKMFRDPDNALLPNWRHLPVGYHGRASSIIVSGQPIHRPWGQLKPEDGAPVHKPTQRLDFELEMAFVVGKPTNMGETVSTALAEDHIFGMVLFNDWSARDVQKWEYVPLGPFLAKNFASSISPWVVPLEALEPFRVAGPAQEPEVLPYLKYSGHRNFDIHLEVDINDTNICRSNFKYMYWNMAQQLSHHTMNGCNLNVGDMMASGTISGKEPDSYGSMLELTWGGKNPLKLNDGSERKFIEDHDTVTMRAYCQKGDIRVGFGEVSTRVLPAH